MDNQKHQQEIEQSHLAGFGGSDAAMFAAIAEKGLEGISQTYLNRIGEVMGLREPRPRFTNEAMENGHKFEEWVEREVLSSALVEREKLIEWRLANNFRTFAHADFAVEMGGYVVYELKWSGFTTEEVMRKYRWQFQWYYLLGVDIVSLIHGFGDIENPTREQRKIEPCYSDMQTLNRGITILDEAMKNGWQPQVSDAESLDSCPFPIFSAVECLHELTRKAKELEEEIARQKAIVLEYMADNVISSIAGFRQGEAVTVSYVRPSKSSSFDSKAYFKAHPVSKEDKAAFTVEKEKAGYVSFTAKAPKSDDTQG